MCTNCPICHENMSLGDDLPIIVTECNHTFHTNCLNNWFQTAGTCPMCRGQLIDRPSSPTSVLDFYQLDFEPLHDSPIIGLFLPNYDLGQRLDYGDI